MPQLTFEECKEAHKEMWMWLHKNPMARKEDWPEWEAVHNKDQDNHVQCATYKGQLIPYMCFACYWACSEDRGKNETNAYHGRDCRRCPIDWLPDANCLDKDDTMCVEQGSIYDEWGNDRYFEAWANMKKLAKEISKMEWTDRSTDSFDDISHED